MAISAISIFNSRLNLKLLNSLLSHFGEWVSQSFERSHSELLSPSSESGNSGSGEAGVSESGTAGPVPSPKWQ